MNLLLLKYLLNNTIFKKYSNNIYNIFKENKEINILYKYIEKLHDIYNKDLSVEEFTLYVLSNCHEKDKEVLSSLLEEINSLSMDNTVLEDILQSVLQKQQAYDVALAALEVSEGRKDFSDLLLLTQNLNSTDSVLDPSVGFVSNDIFELYNETIKKQGLRWRLDALNIMLGSLRKGDFGFVFARPETGKTTFLASEVTFMATQLKEDSGPILWFNNEEGGNKVQLRVYQAMLGYDQFQLFYNLQETHDKYFAAGGSKIKIYDSAAIHRKQVEHICRALQPSLVLFDQIDKIKGFTDDREDLRLGAIYIWARELAKEFCPVIGVCQADVSGEGKAYLTMENVANAKTAKQAEADWILGIGKTHKDVDEYTRFLHLSKNKLTGDEDSDPARRHGKASVVILPEIARYQDL